MTFSKQSYNVTDLLHYLVFRTLPSRKQVFQELSSGKDIQVLDQVYVQQSTHKIELHPYKLNCENNEEHNYSDSKTNCAWGADNYINKQPKYIHHSTNANVRNTDKTSDIK